MDNRSRKKYIQKIVTGLLAFVIVMTVYTGVVVPKSAAASSCTKWLTAHDDWLKLQEGHYLEAPFEYNGNDYTIIDMRTYQSYHWAKWGIYPGHTTRFGVSTGWAWQHPTWGSDPWLLVYKC